MLETKMPEGWLETRPKVCPICGKKAWRMQGYMAQFNCFSLMYYDYTTKGWAPVRGVRIGCWKIGNEKTDTTSPMSYDHAVMMLLQAWWADQWLDVLTQPRKEPLKPPAFIITILKQIQKTNSHALPQWVKPYWLLDMDDSF